MRLQRIMRMCLTVVSLVILQSFPAMAGEKSDAKVKAMATAGKLGADGKQTVTITLDVEKGWYIYANPVNANSDIFGPNVTVVAFKTKDKLKADVKYPKGKQKVDGKYQFDVYVDRVTIEATVQRPAGDETPLRISIDVNVCRKNECLLPGTVMLTIP
jgi:DsbC/DsbD-like thiol-disulfide interchange protein